MPILSLDRLKTGFLRDLLKGCVRFIVVGGVAVNLHGHRRPTTDLDVLSEPTSENAGRLANALYEFGLKNNKVFDLRGHIERLGKPNLQMPVWSKDDFIGLEILTSIDGVSFTEAYKQAVMHDEVGLNVPILSKDHLVRSKAILAQSDEKHRADVKALTASK